MVIYESRLTHDIGTFALDLFNHLNVLDGFLFQRLSSSDDASRERKRGSDQEPSRLGNNPDPFSNGKVDLQAVPEDLAHLVKHDRLETSADVQKGESVPLGFTHFEYLLGPPDGVCELHRVLAARTDVEGNPDDVQTELFGELDQPGASRQGSSKLEAEPTERLGIVRQDSEDQFGTPMRPGNLMQLVGVVKRHHFDATVGRGSDEADGLARVGKDDPVRGRRRGEREHRVDLGDRGAVERGAHEGQQVKDNGGRVTLDRVKDLDPVTQRRLLPLLHGRIDVRKVSDEKGRLLAAQLRFVDLGLDQVIYGSIVYGDEGVLVDAQLASRLATGRTGRRRRKKRVERVVQGESSKPVIAAGILLELAKVFIQGLTDGTGRPLGDETFGLLVRDESEGLLLEAGSGDSRHAGMRVAQMQRFSCFSSSLGFCLSTVAECVVVPFGCCC